MTVTILNGDVRAVLRRLPSAYFDCVVSSPPYWGLRSYLPDGDPLKKFEIGLEPTLGEHLDVMVTVFREVRRVLKSHGTLWLNYGDCYAAAPNGKSAADYKADGSDDRTFRDKPFSTVGPVYDPAGGRSGGAQRGDPKRLAVGASIPNGRVVAGGLLKPKDLCMVPNRLAIALQDDGWWVRSEIIWHKPNPMPESVYDRPTSAHEKVWLLTKSEDYFYNHEAIREAATGGAHARVAGQNSREHNDRVPLSRKKIKVPGGWDVAPGAHGTINRSGRTEATYRDEPGVTPKSAPEGSRIKSKGSFNAALSRGRTETRNARNVWFGELNGHAEENAEAVQAVRPDTSARGILHPEVRDGREYLQAVLDNSRHRMEGDPEGQVTLSRDEYLALRQAAEQEVFRQREGARRDYEAPCSAEGQEERGDLYPDAPRVAGDQNERRSQMSLLPQEDGEACDGPCHTIEQGRPSRSVKHRAGVQKLQQQKGNKSSDASVIGSNLWTIAPKAFRGAHFATFPPALAERCIKAGAPLSTCHLCGEAKLADDCGGICVGQERAPGRVLDPFGGAGTVGLVAAGLGLDCTLIEIKPSDVAMSAARIRDALPAVDVVVEPDVSRALPEPRATEAIDAPDPQPTPA